jgi:hypothetical protein
MRLDVDPVETRLKAARQSLATSSDVARLHGLEYVKDDLWIGRHETGISVFSGSSLWAEVAPQVPSRWAFIPSGLTDCTAG